MAVIGAGPAGIATAIQLQKEGVKARVFEMNQIGGLLRYANLVTNMPGYHGKSGREICRLLSKQVEKLGITVEKAEVRSVQTQNDEVVINVNGNELGFSYVIGATGTCPRQLGINNIKYTLEDAAPEKGRRALVVGGGDIAFDSAVRLTNAGARVDLLVRGIRANLELRKMVKERGITIYTGEVKDMREHDRQYMIGELGPYDSVYAFIGRLPNRSIFSDLDIDTISLPSGRTNIKSIYMVGDLTLGSYRQASLAWGTGLAAAMDIAKKMKR